jgi:hypothetical protein
MLEPPATMGAGDNVLQAMINMHGSAEVACLPELRQVALQLADAGTRRHLDPCCELISESEIGRAWLRSVFFDCQLDRNLRAAAISALADTPSASELAAVMGACGGAGDWSVGEAVASYRKVLELDARTSQTTSAAESVTIALDVFYKQMPRGTGEESYVSDIMLSPTGRWARRKLASYDSNFVAACLAEFRPRFEFTAGVPSPSELEREWNSIQFRIARMYLDPIARERWDVIVDLDPSLR